MSPEILSSWFPTRSDTNSAEQPQLMARDLRFWVYVEEGIIPTL